MADENDQPQHEIAERLRALEIENAELRGKLSAQPAVPAKEPEKEWTRAELNQQVLAGAISQDDADRLIDAQIQRRLERQVESKISETVDNRTLVDRLDREIEEYVSLKPDIRKAGAADRQRVEDEFTFLVRNGSPSTKATELAALRAVFGPVAKLKAAAAVGEGRRETHRETGGAGGDAGTDDNLRQDGSPKGLTARQRAHYTRAIEQGIYRNWEQVAKELEYQRTDLTQRFSGEGAYRRRAS